jgi:outer membrane protein OmpA-like peptidoglycan-associated protein
MEALVRSAIRTSLLCATLGTVLALTTPLFAQTAPTYNNGFQLNRYEPTAAGEWSFMVDHPWYSSTRYFAAGMTLNYAHNPLVFGQLQPNGSFSANQAVIANQLLGHFDFAGSFLDRVTLTMSLPVTFVENGTTTPIAGVLPKNSPGVGDPRMGGMVRVWKQPDEDVVSVSLGAFLWIPLRALGSSSAFYPTTGELGVRFMPKIAVGGLWNWLRWSFTAAFYYRPEATLGNLDNLAGSKTGSELQFGLSAYYADKIRRFAVGPEMLLATQVIGAEGSARDTTSLEILLGAHYNIARQVQVGIAGGIGALRVPGTPDGRFLFRLAYAPMRQACADSDGDGICDTDDACPDVRGIRTGDPQTNGCPPGDRDGDGYLDPEDMCPDEPMGQYPDPAHQGCPLADRDKDGLPDVMDQCPDVPMGDMPDPSRPGCPLSDRDGDGIYDPDDLCPDVPQGPRPDPNRRGCPASDRDHDGVIDSEDMCPDVPQGPNPDPGRPGCPMRDRDHDMVPDIVDACPDKPGVPDLDPKKNGCPGGLVTVTNGEIKLLQPVFFATDQDLILPQSFPVLQAVANVLRQAQQIRRLAVDGHTDNRGGVAHNQDLSERRARSVVLYLTEQGIAAERLEAHGYGQSRPIRPNATQVGRAANRRVEFHVVDPPMGGGVQESNPDTFSSPDTTDVRPDLIPPRKAGKHR